MEAVNAEMLQGLYGSMIIKDRAVGYCKRHGCYLTCNTLKKHECLRKQCNALEKHSENNYWKQRELKKEIKRASKLNKGAN